MKKPTLDDVARIAGVSRAAASRALNGRPGVRDDVRERVTLVAEQLGFRPNRAARNLASGRSSIVGLIIPMLDLQLEPFGAAIIQGFGHATARRDLGLTLHLTQSEPGRVVSNIVRDGLLDGVLIGTSAIGTWADELFDSPLPTVLVGTHPTRTDVSSVDVDNVGGAQQVVGHLLEQGCDHIGLISGRPDRAASVERIEGYRRAHEAAGRRVDEALITGGNFSRSSGVAAANRLLDRGVDAIFGANDEMAHGAIWTAAQRGLDVPRDLLVAGFDGTSRSDYDERALTTVAQPFDEIATASLDLLDELIAGRPGRSTVLDVELVIGTTSIRPSG